MAIPADQSPKTPKEKPLSEAALRKQKAEKLVEEQKAKEIADAKKKEQEKKERKEAKCKKIYEKYNPIKFTKNLANRIEGATEGSALEKNKKLLGGFFEFPLALLKGLVYLMQWARSIAQLNPRLPGNDEKMQNLGAVRDEHTVAPKQEEQNAKLEPHNDKNKKTPEDKREPEIIVKEENGKKDPKEEIIVSSGNPKTPKGLKKPEITTRAIKEKEEEEQMPSPKKSSPKRTRSTRGGGMGGRG